VRSQADASWGGGPAWVGTAATFIFKLSGEGAASERFDPTGADELYQFAYPGDWPYWGSGHDLHMGGGRALGTDGYCLQGTTYAGTPNQICGCNAYENNGCWGATELVVLGR